MNKIEIENPREWVWGGYPDNFEEIEVNKDYDTLYKDMCSATTIFRNKDDDTYWALDWDSYESHYGDDTYWALDWDSYESHYGSGESNYDNYFIYQVEPKIKVIEVKSWEVV